MARFQELIWNLGSEFVPEPNIPLLIRIVSDPKNIYRAFRLIVDESVVGGTLYVLWNTANFDQKIPTIDDVDPNNSFTFNQIYEWAYLV